MMRAFIINLIAVFALTAGVRAQSFEQTYPVENLASIMGELHYLSYNCQGRRAQDWRETMLEMLELEAPTRGAYRERLVDAFNDGFYRQSDRRPRCGAETEFQQRILAERGRALSDQIRRTYIE